MKTQHLGELKRLQIDMDRLWYETDTGTTVMDYILG